MIVNDMIWYVFVSKICTSQLATVHRQLLADHLQLQWWLSRCVFPKSCDLKPNPHDLGQKHIVMSAITASQQSLTQLIVNSDEYIYERKGYQFDRILYEHIRASHSSQSQVEASRQHATSFTLHWKLCVSKRSSYSATRLGNLDRVISEHCLMQPSASVG